MDEQKVLDIWSLREKAYESWDYGVSNILVYLAKFSNTDNQSVNFAAEEYIRGRRWCELHLCLERNGHSHYVAIIESAVNQVTGINAFRNLEVKCCSLSRNDPMFVNIAELIKLPEQVVFIACPSKIWLKRLDFIDSAGRDVSGDVVKSLELFRGIFVNDGESGAVTWPVSGSKRKLPSDMVKSGTETVYGIACNNGEMWVDDGDLATQDIERMVRIFIAGNAKGFQILELNQFGVQNIEVFFRPFDLQLRVLERRLHRTDYVLKAINNQYRFKRHKTTTIS